MINRASLFFRGASGIALAVATVVTASSAMAQVAAPAPAAPPAAADPSDTSNQEIVVTGSHLGRTTFNSPTPVNVIGDQRLKDLGIPAVADALNQLPSFRASSTPTTPLFRVSGAIGANSPDLRGLGPTRTLVLVDGRRFVPETDSGQVDLNAIPSAMVKRTEVVTGGASAAYGADAVAGVVNLILDTKFTGVKTDFNGGISGHGDNKNIYASFMAGQDFAGGRGHFIIGAEYQKNYGVGACETRAYCHNYENYVANPGYINGASTNGLPATLVLPHVLFVYNPTGILVSAVQTVGGVKTTLGQQVNNAAKLPAALQGLQFDAAGTNLVPYQFGNYLSGTFEQGGDPSSSTKLWGWGDEPLVTPTWHVSTMAHANYDLTDKIQLSAEFLFSRVNGGPVVNAPIFETPVGSTVGISINNPYITPAVRAQILAANPNITSINVNVVKPELGNQSVATSTNDTYRGVLAAKGTIFKNFTWDVSYEHGETRSHLINVGTRLKTFDTDAPQAVTPPAGYTGTVYQTSTGAPVICASSVAAPANGCFPIDFFGANSVSAAAIAKYEHNEYQTRIIKQDDISANLRGKLIDLWAGPLQGAIGIEYRRDSAEGDTDPLTLAGLFVSPQTTALPLVKREVVEGYIEGSLPLLADMRFAKSLAVDGSVRRTHYNSFGSATTWKVGAAYQPDDQLMIRVTKSRDIRAPTAAESNPNVTSTPLPLADPFGGGTRQITSVSGGNANLQLERANTFTAGVVMQPHFIPHLRVSADYYNIRVNQVIDTLPGASIINACATQNLECNLIQFSGAFKASPISTVFTNFQNLSTLRARGLEFVAEYRFDHVVGGSLNLAVNANYVLELITVGATGAVTQFDGVTGNAGSLSAIGGVPTYKLDGIATYSHANWSFTLHGRYIPKSILDPTKIGPEDPGYNINLANSITTNRVAARFYLDLSATIRTSLELIGHNKMELYGNITNVTDSYPPGTLRFFGNPLQYDVVGRAFRLGVRTQW